MEIHAHIPARRRPRRVLAGLALLLALLACAALSAAAYARTAHNARDGHRSGCTAARHAKHGAGKHCAKHHGGKTHGAHKTKKPAPKPPAPKLTPAVCEDGSIPTRATSGSYGCEDGSEPACEDGSEPIRPSSSSAPMCTVPREEDPPECVLEATGACNAEFACEDPEEATTAPKGCEYGSAFEEEGEPAA